jgi:hypothetical protein
MYILYDVTRLCRIETRQGVANMQRLRGAAGLVEMTACADYKFCACALCYRAVLSDGAHALTGEGKKS